MGVEQITISVDHDVAEAYRCASESERRQLDLLVSMRLREATASVGSLQEVAREISEKSQDRGLTPDILRGILDE